MVRLLPVLKFFLEFPLLFEHETFLNEYRENLKLLEQPLDLITLIDAKVVDLLTEEGPIRRPILEALQNRVKTINSISLIPSFCRRTS